MIRLADVVVAEFGSLMELFTDHLGGVVIFHVMAGENTAEVFPVALVGHHLANDLSDSRL